MQRAHGPVEGIGVVIAVTREIDRPPSGVIGEARVGLATGAGALERNVLIPGVTKLHRLEADLAAGDVASTAEGLDAIDKTLSALEVVGARCGG